MTGKSKQNQKAPPRRRRPRRRGKRVSLSPLAQMIANPCDGPIVPYASTEGGYVSRFVRELTLHSTGATNNGYVVLFPDYHNDATQGQGGNLFFYENADPTIPPVNTAANPLGTGGTSGTFANDPAYNFVTGTVCRDARTLASCIRLLYTGKLTDTQGTICSIREFSAAQFFNGSGTLNVPPSVEQMFQFSPTEERLNPQGMELKYRPHDDTSVPRTSGVSTNALSDRCFTIGTSGTAATSIPSGDTTLGDRRAIAIAWRGINTAATGDMRFRLFKVVEWRPRMASGLVESKPVTSGDSDQFGKQTRILDRLLPGWQQQSGPSGLDMMRDAILTGGGNMLRGFAESAARGTWAALTDSRTPKMLEYAGAAANVIAPFL